MKRTIHLKVWFTLMILSNLFFVQQSKASHSMGADLTYVCLGGNTYKITLSFYRDCVGIPAPVNPFVNITSASCGVNLGVTCYARPGTGQEITPACSSALTTCRGGSFTGIQEYVYDGIFTLPMQCTDWVFGYNLCCRNAAITNITSPGSNTFYIYSTLNNTISPCNSSPTFSNKPVPFLCLGQQYCFNHGAYDIDGDSLAYSLITPKQTSTTIVNYISPYTAYNPLNSVPTTTFNPLTGDICLTPQALQVTVMAVLVKEYRNGVLIGSVERDLQLTVMNCNNNLPTLTGINGTNNFSMTVCAGQPFCFDIFSNDVDTGQDLTVTWNNGIPNGTFTSSTSLHPTSTFCWTPSASDISNTPYVFTVRVIDDACPYYGSQIYSYSITVIGMTVDAGPDQQIACSDLATLTATASGGSGTYTYAWSNGSTMQTVTVGGGTYFVTASDGTCSATDTVVVSMPYIPTAAFYLSIPNCLNYLIQFYDQSSTPGGVLNSWSWDFGDGFTSSSQNPTHQYGSPGTYTVTLIVGNNLGCFDTLVQPIDITPPPVVAFTAADGCAGQTVVFTDQSSGTTLNFWNWNFGDGATSTNQNPTHTYGSPGTYNVTLVSGDSSGCVDTAYQVIQIYPLPVVNAGVDQAICAGGSVTLTATGGSSYNWTTGDTLPVIIVSPGSTTDYYVSVTDVNGCTAVDMVTVIIHPLPVANAGPDQNICIGNSATLTATGGGTYSWNPGGSNASTITVTPGSATTYTVTVSDANGCSSTDNVTVNVNPLPTATVSPDVDMCAGSDITLTGSGGTSYYWIPTGATTPTISVSPASTTTYTVIVSDGIGCSDSASVTVQVHQPPVVTLQSFFLCNGNNATLDAGNPGSTYVWAPNGETTQVINITTGGTYSVTVTDGYGCSAIASCTIISGSSLTITLPTVSFCQGDSALLDAGYPGMTYLWIPNGETTQTIMVYSGGTYGVTVTDTSGCTGSITTTVVVNPIPVADFTATNICEGSTTTFTDASSVAPGSINGWWWTFGDGNVSAQQNPTHTYGSAGTYIVTLTVTSTGGCSDSVTNTVTVNPLPVANFNFENECQDNSVVFTDLSGVASGNIIAYLWNFGDGFTSTAQNPTHQYTAAGNYNVVLQVTTAGGCIHSVTRTITVFPLPVAGFTSSPVCLGNPTVFVNTSAISTGSITNYAWDFGDSYTSTQQQPNHIYASAGSFNVSLIITSSNGCTDTMLNTALVNPLPVANAGSDQNICSGSGATLTASGGTTYYWSPGGLNTTTIQVNPSSTTTYNVTVTDANGCEANDNITVNVDPLPVANAGPDKSICAGSAATLNASGGLTYSWNPGGSTNSSINVTPTSDADYIVTVTDANGCQASDTVRVTVNPIPAISAGPDQAICIGSTISISASGGVNYNWNPGGFTSPTILVTPSSGTNYVVTGTDANGCQSADTMHVTVNNIPTVNIPTTLLCVGFTATLNAGNPGSTYSWSTGESTQSISVSDSGIYTVVVTSPNGCSALGNAYVILAGAFNTNPTNISTCLGQIATLNAGNPGCTYMWSTGETTQSITVNSAGSYSVTVTDPAGCSGTIYSNVVLNPIPVANFSATPACFGASNSFNDQSSVNTGTIQHYNWDFGDGFSSTLQNPTHTYQAPGTYYVTHLVISSGGCVASRTRPVTVNSLPVADFTNTTVCQNQATVFNNLSSIANGSIVSWNWNFGDGTFSSAQNPSHIYGNAGSYNASLIVTSQHGCQTSINKNILVKGLPVAAFSAPNVCAGTSVQFYNLSSSSNGSITGYNWNFGNGNSSTSINPGIVFSPDGIYNVQLIVTTTLGCADTAIHPVTIYPLPAAHFVASPACENSPAVFINTSTVNGGLVTSQYWNFGDGSSSNQINPIHTFANDGTYNITLIVKSNNECRDTVTQNLVIHPLPVANFNAQDVCVNSPSDFLDASTISSGTIASWSWNFGDNTTSSNSGPAHIYSQPGTYDVTLTVTSNYGCSNTYHSNVNIFPDPVAAFSGANVCFSNSTQFFNQSYITGGSSFTTDWDFGDGGTSTLNNPTHTFANPGYYGVTLTVTSPNGCSSQITHNTRVYYGPTASFDANSGCLGLITEFIDYSNAIDGGVTAWLWDFGDGTTSISSSPLHMYIDTGIYQVILTVTTEYGCVNSTSRNIEIYPVPSPLIKSSNECFGTPIVFSDVSGDNSSDSIIYTWDFSDGFQATDSVTSHTFSSPGTFQVTLTTSNSHGCYAADMVSVTAYPKPEIVFNAPAACFPASTQFHNASTIGTGNISTYSWNFGDGNSASVTNPNHTYATPGTYYATLVGTSDNGCVNSDTQLVKINPTPEANFGSTLSGCSPLIASFFDSSWISQGSIAGWLWEFGDGGVSTQQHPSHVFTQSGSYSITLNIVSDEGCQTSITRPNSITVLPSPEAAFTVSPDVIDIMDPTVHFNNLSQGYSSYTWIFGDGTTISNVVSPTHLFAETGTYSALLIIVNAYGCRDTAYRSVEILPHSTLYAPNCFTPNGDGKNDRFQPAYTEMNRIQVWIFNRWGELLTSWDGLDGYWDGYYKDQACQDDVYIYRIKGLGDDGKNYEWTGHVSIVH